MNRNYQAGRRAEWRARDILLARGHHTVMRAAGSHGPADLIGIAREWTRLVQVKRGKLSKVERAKLLILKALLPKCYSLEVWYFTKGKRYPVMETI